MRAGAVLIGALVMVLALGSAAAAGYISDGDITLSVTVASELVQTSGDTGQTTFALQEGVHDSLADSTGQEVDHSYVWIQVNGEYILAVDPPRAYTGGVTQD